MFLLTPAPRLIAADSFVLTPRPPASSEELTIDLPLDSRFKLVRNRLLLVFRFSDAIVAVELVLMDIIVRSLFYNFGAAPSAPCFWLHLIEISWFDSHGQSGQSPLSALHSKRFSSSWCVESCRENKALVRLESFHSRVSPFFSFGSKVRLR